MADNPSKNRDANENRDDVFSIMYRLTVDATANIAGSGGAALPADTTSIALIPEDNTQDIRMAYNGAASATTPHLPVNGIVIPIDKTKGDLLQFYFNGTAYVTLLVYVPRT